MTFISPPTGTVTLGGAFPDVPNVGSSPVTLATITTNRAGYWACYGECTPGTPSPSDVWNQAHLIVAGVAGTMRDPQGAQNRCMLAGFSVVGPYASGTNLQLVYNPDTSSYSRTIGSVVFKATFIPEHAYVH
jgi:hypothetical protein